MLQQAERKLWKGVNVSSTGQPGNNFLYIAIGALLHNKKPWYVSREKKVNNL